MLGNRVLAPLSFSSWTLVQDNVDGGGGSKTVGDWRLLEKMGSLKGSQVWETEVQSLELLEGRLGLNQEKVCKSLVPILVFHFLASPGSGYGRGQCQWKARKVKTLLYLKREEVNRLSMVKEEEGMVGDAGLPSCQICRL